MTQYTIHFPVVLTVEVIFNTSEILSDEEAFYVATGECDWVLEINPTSKHPVKFEAHLLDIETPEKVVDEKGYHGTINEPIVSRFEIQPNIE